MKLREGLQVRDDRLIAYGPQAQDILIYLAGELAIPATPMRYQPCVDRIARFEAAAPIVAGMHVMFDSRVADQDMMRPHVIQQIGLAAQGLAFRQIVLRDHIFAADGFPLVDEPRLKPIPSSVQEFNDPLCELERYQGATWRFLSLVVETGKPELSYLLGGFDRLEDDCRQTQTAVNALPAFTSISLCLEHAPSVLKSIGATMPESEKV